MELEQREFRADPLKMKRLRVAAGMTVKDFKLRSGLDRTTVNKILRGDPVFLKSLTIAAHDVFEIDDPLELLHPEELEAMGIETCVPSPGQILEWEIEDYLSGWKSTANGLQYQIVLLRHRYLPNRFARGKCYELRHMTTEEKSRSTEYLLRHVEVCERIGAHANVACNITAAPVAGLWWVLDRWEDGDTLAERMAEGPLCDYELRVVMTGIAEGLAALHRNEIICRDLSPESILLRQSNDRPILMDLELAKLGEGQPSVSPDEWPDDPYRALEVHGEGSIDRRADIYSWARIFAHAATGIITERGSEDVESLKIPRAVGDWLRQSLTVSPTGRPASFKGIIKAMKAWP